MWCKDNCGDFADEIINEINEARRKRIFLMAYARKNLGDDLFIKMLLEKYPTCEFYMKVKKYEYLEELDKHENLHVIIGDDTDEELYKMDVNEYDSYIYIGGSIFMEGGKVYNLSEKFYDFTKRCKENNKPFFYISSNYGPYQTNEYFELSRKNFKEITDICFRDKYSYDLFKDISTVRYAPDFAFSYNIEEMRKISNSVGITVIDLSIREKLKHKEDDYIGLMVNNIRRYLDDGKKVYLFTFCQNEEDERTLDIIMDRLGNRVRDVRYRGNVDEFIKLYSQMEYMICARFHAMILSAVSDQKIYIMSYSNKIDNVIEDLELDLPTIHFEKIDSNKIIDLSEFKSVPKNKINKIIEESKMQEMALKKALI